MKRKKFKLPSASELITKKLHIAGPCSIESQQQIIQTAQALVNSGISLLRGGVWKPRTRPGTFSGIGTQGLKWLREAGDHFELFVTTEVAEPHHVETCLRNNIDVLWIGARTTTNPFSVQAICDALKGVDIPVMVKNPVNPDIELWIGALERLEKAGVKQIAAIHRGFSLSGKTLYRNTPIWRIPIELRRRYPNIPLICDPSHICGTRKRIAEIAQEAMDLLYNGLMVEVHPDPAKALSDSAQQITPLEFIKILNNLTLRTPNAENETYENQIAGIRKEIDEIDHGIIDLLSRRMEKVEELAECKRTGNISSFQPKRWQQILKTRISEGMHRNLSKEFIGDIYERIHEESLMRQEKFLTSQKKRTAK